MTQIEDTQEGKRLIEDRNQTKYWKRWGSYLSERQWGTVREDYSPYGNAWDYLSHEQSRSRAYRWGEDGIAGISDNHQLLCFAIALWNGEDPILKERLFGLTNSQGNHGEDVKEYYFYLDNTPTHSYMKYLYKYPQAAYPYQSLVEENGRRKSDPSSWEFEIIDTGVFNDNRYFDVFVEYAKNTPDDISIKITVSNRGPEPKTIQILPSLWFRNTWSWGYPDKEKPYIKQIKSDSGLSVIEAYTSEHNLGKRWLYSEAADAVLYTDNESNSEKLGWGANPAGHYFKDGINDYIVSGGKKQTVNPNQVGTKAAAHYKLEIGAGETKTIRLRLSDADNLATPFGNDFETVFQVRQREADEFYQSVCPFSISEDMRNVQRQAFAGMLWGKQYYKYIIQQWLDGDPGEPSPPPKREGGRNHDWTHLVNQDILSMPDTWEYPWFAAWDLAFHTISLALIDPDFAKRQLYLLMQEYYMHPNGQIPAYEWAFGDVNPPVHAWAAWRIYKIEEKMYGHADRDFLNRVFQKLALNFTWWVNRKDANGNNIFQGGFLGLDNIGIFDRSAKELPTGGQIDQSDGTSWMGMYCLNMLRIAIELAKKDLAYLDMVRKFFQHFLLIADAVNKAGGDENLWDENDGFYYDVLQLPKDRLLDGKEFITLKVRSIVGVIPIFAVEAIDQEFWDSASGAEFKERYDWFLKNRADLTQHDNITLMGTQGNLMKGTLLSIVNPDKLKRILQKMLDEAEFLSPYGIRALSKYHDGHPFTLSVNGKTYKVDYEPAESRTGDFGGNSNWRGPVWFPVNFLIIESLQKFHRYLGNDFKVEFPTGSGKMLNLWEVALELSQRLMQIFLKDSSGKRPVYGGIEKFQNDPHWRDFILFYEYFHGDIGAGLGASHQTGWTGVVAKLIQQWGEYPGENKAPEPDEKTLS